MQTEAKTTFRPAEMGDAALVRGIVWAAYSRWVAVIGREPLPMSADYGKAILARAAVDGAGAITLTANYQVNTYDGVYINGDSNRAIYGSATPAAGFHSVGDLLYYTAPAAAGNIGEVCTAAGSPGTWKTWGAISA